MFDLFLREPFHRIRRVHDNGDAVVRDDGRFHVHALGRSRAHLGRLRAPARHADLRGAVDDGGNAGGGTFGGDVEGGPGMLRFKLLRELRHEFRPERIGAFDDELFGARFRSDENERESGEKISQFHVGFLFLVKTSRSGRLERFDICRAG